MLVEDFFTASTINRDVMALITPMLNSSGIQMGGSLKRA